MTTFRDLIFNQHGSGKPSHIHAIHTLANGVEVSVTNGSAIHEGSEKPYEVMVHGECHENLSASDVTALLLKVEGERPPRKLFTQFWGGKP